MKKLSVAVLATIMAGGVSAAETQNARSVAMGGASVVAGNYGMASTNPAMASMLAEDDDFGTRLNVGVEASDEDDFLDGIDKAQAEIEALEQSINNASYAPGDEATALQAIDDLEGRIVRLKAGTDFQIAIPSSYLGSALFVKSNLRAGLDFDNQDTGPSLVGNGGQSDSEVRASGYGLTEVGIALSHRYDDLGAGDFIIGVSPKLQRIDLISTRQNVSDFDTTSIRDDLTEDTGFNADIGAIYLLGEDRQYRIGAAVQNLVPTDVEGTDGETFELEPQLSLGLAYDNGWFAATLEADANDSPEYGLAKAAKYARFGLELDAFKWAQLRAGVRHDLNGENEDVMTAGIGLSPMDVINIDIAGIYGKNNTYGAAVQIGARF